jgi:hypothetical protein
MVPRITGPERGRVAEGVNNCSKVLNADMQGEANAFINLFPLLSSGL